MCRKCQRKNENFIFKKGQSSCVDNTNMKIEEVTNISEWQKCNKKKLHKHSHSKLSYQGGCVIKYLF